MNKIILRRWLLVLLTFLYCSGNLFAQTKWTITDPDNLNFIITTEINANELTGKTRENALKDYVGGLKYRLAKLATSLKYPEIVRFSGTFTDEQQTTFSGTYDYLFNHYNCTGKITGDSISIVLLNQKNKRIKELKGFKNKTGLAAVNYKEQVQQILQLTAKNLYDPEFTTTRKWKDFKEIMTANANRMTDDLEIQTGFQAIAQNFPFTHYYLLKTPKEERKAKNFILTAINKETCVLKIKAFEGSRDKIDYLLDSISGKGYVNLIIDLRNNAGGTNETALPLMEFISEKPITGGIFPNQSWYQKFGRSPSVTEYNLFNEFTEGTLAEFYKKAENGYGVYIKSIPAARNFKGKVYVLTNQYTASTSEVVALALKENHLAVLAGKKTAGAVLSGKRFEISETLNLFIPVNDYISYGGYRIDRQGIEPDIALKTDDELNELLKRIEKN